jgi:mRNA degradation ribonuclease J1/J2
MPVELAQRYPFSVDTWTEASTRKRFHFLTHAHKDHTAGIENLGFSSIYCTDITQKLVIRRYPKVRTCSQSQLALSFAVIPLQNCIGVILSFACFFFQFSMMMTMQEWAVC